MNLLCPTTKPTSLRKTLQLDKARLEEQKYRIKEKSARQDLQIFGSAWFETGPASTSIVISPR